MDATIEVKAFGKAIKESVKALPKGHYSLPILANVRLEADECGMWITTTNLDWYLTQYIEAKTSEAGATAIPAKALSDILSKLSKKNDAGDAETVQIHANGNNQVSLIGPCDARLTSIDAEDFPPTPTPKSYVEIHALTDGLKEAIDTICSCAADEDTRPVLQSVFCEYHDNSIEFTAADGFRLGHFTIGAMCEGASGEFLLPTSALSKMAKVIGKRSELCRIFHNPTNVAFMFDNILIQITCVQGTFPNYRQLIPTEWTTRALVEREALLSVIQSAAVFAKSGSGIVRFEVSENAVTISAKAEDLGNYIKTISCQTHMKAEPRAIYISDNLPDPMCAMPKARIAFNAKYLTDCLGSWDRPLVCIQFDEPSGPGMFIPCRYDVNSNIYDANSNISDAENPSRWQVIMPMFVQWEEQKNNPLPEFSDWGVGSHLPSEADNASGDADEPNVCANCDPENLEHGYVESWDGVCPDCGRQIPICRTCANAPDNGGECHIPTTCTKACGVNCGAWSQYTAPDQQMKAAKAQTLVTVSPHSGYPDGWDERHKSALSVELPDGATFYSTPGHGYLVVDTRIHSVSVSEYDYLNGDNALLEEDCSAEMWLAEKGLIHMDDSIVEMITRIPRVLVTHEIDPDDFCNALRTKGYAVGTNGATYKCIEWGSLNVPAFERTSKDGKRDIMVGSRGETFSSREAAISWARWDQQNVNKDPMAV
jgi:DNA polymerase-3 subunit beta